LTFIPGDDVEKRLLPLGSENGLEVVLDFATGRELFMGRLQEPPIE